VGPLAHFSDTWQLFINTATTVLTYLAVFLIQNTQNRDMKALQLKLNELISSTEGARNALVNLENLTDEQLDQLQNEFARLQKRVKQGQSLQTVDYSSTEGTKISTSASAEAATIGKAEISIDFSRQGAFLFQASKLQTWQLENRMVVGEQIVKAYGQKKWDKSWLLVESLHASERATIVVAEDSAAGLVIVAKMDEALPSISLVDPKISLSVTSTRGKMMRLIGSEGLHPLYSCLRLKDPLFGSPSVQPVRGIKDARVESDFSRPGISELLDS
jgi:low affinity Fe/Cu permease